jgi:hypothetical protein
MLVEADPFAISGIVKHSFFIVKSSQEILSQARKLQKASRVLRTAVFMGNLGGLSYRKP